MEERIIQLLKEKGLRITAVRKKVLSIFLAAGHEALSNAAIEAHFNSLDRITLYRTLRTFEEKGIIHQVLDGTNTPKFAFCSNDCGEHEHHDDHPHFHCVDCGKTVCLEDIKMPAVKFPEGYEVQEKYLVLSGKCASCN